MSVSLMTDDPYFLYDKEYTLNQASGEVLRQTERHLEEQQRLTSAADQRAIAFAAVLIVVAGLLLSNSASGQVDELKLFVVLLLLVSICLAIFSARPTRIYGSGGSLSSLENYLIEPNHGYLVRTILRRNQRNIEHNDRVLKSSAKIFRISLTFSALAVILLMTDMANINIPI